MIVDRKLTGLIVGAALLFFFSGRLSGAAQVPYVTNLDNALSLAKNEGRLVVLYTGRSVFCQGKTPRAFFFDFIMKRHPEFGTRSNRFVICEQFMFAPNGTNGPTLDFMLEFRKYDALFKRYHLAVFYPTLTFLDENARLLNGPFWSMILCDDPFSSTEDLCYGFLKDYLAAASPMNMDIAQSNLVAAVLAAGPDGNACGFFRGICHTNGGQQELLMNNGLPSRQYEVGSPFKFTIRKAQLDRGPLAHWYDESQVWVIGQLEGSESYTGTVLFQLNGVWFSGTMRAFQPARSPLRTSPQLSAAREGDHWFVLTTRSERAGQALLEGINRLPHLSEHERSN